MNLANHQLQIYVNLKAHIDVEIEVKRIAKKLSKIEGYLQKLLAKKEKPSYKEKVPEHVQKQNEKKIQQYQTEIGILKEGIRKFEELL